MDCLQIAVLEEAESLSTGLTLPNLSSEAINRIVASANKLERKALGFVPFMHGSAKGPADNGITLTLNVTEVCS